MDDKPQRDLKGRFVKGVKNEWTFEKGIRKPHQSKGFKGTAHYNWKGGKIKDGKGYVYIHKPEHPQSNYNGYVYEHRLIMEKHLGRCLNKNEVVHHKDENKQNNNIENLQLMTMAEHCAFHKSKSLSPIHNAPDTGDTT